MRVDCGIPDTERETCSVSDLLFKSLAELVRDYGILPQDLDVAPQVEVSEDSVLVMPVPEEVAPEPDDPDLQETRKP